MRLHWQNLNDNNKHWLHGRAWLTLLGWRFNPEWLLFRWAFGLSVSGAYSEPGVTIHISPLIGSFFLTIGASKYGPISRFMSWRKFGFSFHDGGLWVHLFCREDRWISNAPFWTKPICFNFKDILLGRAKYSKRILSTHDVIIPMPERGYKATVNIEERTWNRPRWFKDVVRGANIEIPGGIPHPGKGENGWDCGMDGIFGMSCSADNIEDAISEVVRSSLRNRRRYAGSAMWVPKEDELHTTN